MRGEVDAPTRLTKITEDRMPQFVRMPIGRHFEAAFVVFGLSRGHIVLQRLSVRLAIDQPHELGVLLSQRFVKLIVTGLVVLRISLDFSRRRDAIIDRFALRAAPSRDDIGPIRDRSFANAVSVIVRRSRVSRAVAAKLVEPLDDVEMLGLQLVDLASILFKLIAFGLSQLDPRMRLRHSPRRVVEYYAILPTALRPVVWIQVFDTAGSLNIRQQCRCPIFMPLFANL